MTKKFLTREKPIQDFDKIKSFFYDKKCLEIGGPSSIFLSNSFLPLYNLVGSIDNVNYSKNNLWRKRILYSFFSRKWFQNQFTLDATNLNKIKEESYDAILSSHALEHIANPLRALFEWKRVLKTNGVLLLILPHKSATFDHNRPITSEKHFLEDYENNIDEHDLSHITEILSSHDFSLDPSAKSPENFAIRSRNNFYNRYLHHHVFVTESAIRIMNQAKMQVLYVGTYLPYHIIVFAIKLPITKENQKEALLQNNLSFLHKDASWRKLSCFEIDKTALKVFS